MASVLLQSPAPAWPAQGGAPQPEPPGAPPVLLHDAFCLEVCRLLRPGSFAQWRATAASVEVRVARHSRIVASARMRRSLAQDPDGLGALDAYCAWRLTAPQLAERLLSGEQFPLLQRRRIQAAGFFRASGPVERTAFVEAVSSCLQRDPPKGEVLADCWSLPEASHVLARIVDPAPGAWAHGGGWIDAQCLDCLLHAEEEYLFGLFHSLNRTFARLPARVSHSDASLDRRASAGGAASCSAAAATASGTTTGRPAPALARPPGVGVLFTSGLYVPLLERASEHLAAALGARPLAVGIGDAARPDLVEALHGVLFVQARRFAQLSGEGLAQRVRDLEVVARRPGTPPRPSAVAARAEPHRWRGALDAAVRLQSGPRSYPPAWEMAYYIHGVLSAPEPDAHMEGAGLRLDLLALLALVARDGTRAVAALAREGGEGERALVGELSRARAAIVGGLQELRWCETAVARWRLCPGYCESSVVR
ncbi:unnamed protein product [Prorocentrum cordatum]|uniref:Uncharacterized protein n=1 Tax=Prorocentrum cordatum TaxID=2364126 RepID=A0ABN9UD64_9DINO|nr:unnamed protein product [Polarella glacialis]